MVKLWFIFCIVTTHGLGGDGEANVRAFTIGPFADFNSCEANRRQEQDNNVRLDSTEQSWDRDTVVIVCGKSLHGLSVDMSDPMPPRWGGLGPKP